jgi:hypothetical protein
MRLLAFVLCPALVALGVAATTRAQEPTEEPSPAPVPPRVVPPAVVSMPPVELSAEAQEAVRALADPAVTLVILVTAEGAAELQECPAAEVICADLATAIGQAEFTPARRGDEALPARISLRFVLEAPAAEGEGEPGEAESSAEPATAPSPEEAAEEAEPELAFGATAVVVDPPEGALRLTLDEARNLPGTFGDPFRAVEALPGVTPIVSGLPYFYVRGSPPSGTLYNYDFINMPILFHLGLGPSVIHPRMVGPIRLYSGVAPSRFGRYIGGVIEAEGPEPTQDELIGEAELRLLDVNGFVQTPVGEGELMVAARYGYPGLVLQLVSPGTKLSYWDYQLRFRYPIGGGTDFELVSLGSFDRLATTDTDTDPITGARVQTENALGIHFHRVEARLVHRFGKNEYGAALRFGWGESSLDESGGAGVPPQEVGVRSTQLGPRVWLRRKRPGLTFFLGGEFYGSAGSIDIGDAADGADTSAMNPAASRFLAGVAARSVGALYTELTWKPNTLMTYDFGFRSDLWLAGGTAEVALDPRLRGTFHVHDMVDLHVAVGVTRQPAVFFLPLPGLSEVAIAPGPQVAIQSEAGIAIEPFDELRIEAQAFVHRYTGLLFLDLFLQDETCVEDDIGCEQVEVPDRVDGVSYGAELFIRADPKLRVSGFASYTLSWARIDALPGLDYTPSFDVRHVFNLAGRAWIVPERFSVGLRLHVRTGKPIGVTYFDPDTVSLGRYEQRLPTFYRLDAEIAYRWKTRWGRFRLSLEWLNVTFSREPADLDCGALIGAPEPPCDVGYAPAIVLPNLGLRGTF